MKHFLFLAAFGLLDIVAPGMGHSCSRDAEDYDVLPVEQAPTQDAPTTVQND